MIGAMAQAKSKSKSKSKTDPLIDVVADVFNAFDAEDADDAVIAEFVQGCLDTARTRKLDADLATLMPHCARMLGVTEAAARAAYQSVEGGKASASAAAGTPDELAALAALRATPGRGGATFAESAAKVIAKAWPRLAGPAFGKAMFAGAKDLRLTNLGPLTTLAGLEAAKDVRWLEITVAPSCDLAPLASLTKLGTLVVTGRLAGYAPLAGLTKLTTLTATADAIGLAELAAIPTLRVLTLTVGPDVALAGLTKLAKLNLLTLYAGERTLDDDTASTIRALAKAKKMIVLSPREGWPAQLGLGVDQGWQIAINGQT